MNKLFTCLVSLLFLSVNFLFADAQFDEEHWLSDHQGFNELASKNVNDKLDSAVQTLVAKLIANEKGLNNSIAVSQFLTQDNKMTMLGKIISIKLVKALARSGKFSPLDKDFAFIVTKDMKEGMNQLIDDKSVQNAGKMLGASHVLVGAIDVAGDDIVVMCRLIDMEMSKVQSVAQVSFPSGPGVKHLRQYQIELDPLEADEKKSFEPVKSKEKAREVSKQNFYEAHYMLNYKEKKNKVDEHAKELWEKSHHIIIFTPEGYQQPYKAFPLHEE